MTDGRPPASPGKTSVREQRHITVQIHPGDGGCGCQHLLHARPSFGALIPHHHYISFFDFTRHDGLTRFDFRIEHPSRSLVAQHLIAYGRLLDHAPPGCKVSVQDGETSLGVIGVVHGSNNLVVGVPAVLDVFPHCFAGHGEASFFDSAFAGEFFHHGPDSADTVQIFHMMRSPRAERAQVRGVSADFIDQVQVHRNPGLLCDRR